MQQQQFNPTSFYKFQNSYYYNIPSCNYPDLYYPSHPQIAFDHNYQNTSLNISESSSSSGSIKRKRESFDDEDNLNKKAKFKRYENIDCAICGDKSSGYHYGAYTCEACKLFFTRITKNKRKKKFEDCLLKNCKISIESRSSCGECRFKKCIVVGMSMERSRYGRHIDIPSNVPSSKIIPDSIISTLVTMYKSELKESIEYEFTASLININRIHMLISSFYEKSIALFDNKNNKASNHHKVNLDYKKLDVIFVFYTVLFELNDKFNTLFYYGKLISYLRGIMSRLSALFKDSFSNLHLSTLPLKITFFLYVTYNVLSNNNYDKDNMNINKSMRDLIKSEMITLNQGVFSGNSAENSDCISILNLLTQVVVILISNSK